ncbi:uncharacterized protein LOC134723863 [Mytilus trossulus]|uniref:uncharacterized protein LOC134723863 n=1 Tax=Mytilus trossulus TaxID=6551 RepID=UPI0030051641
MWSILVIVISSKLITCASIPTTPPVWPSAFSVDFVEDIFFAVVKYSHNNGTWYYDFPNGRARYDHLRGQKNNFCGGQKLSDQDPQAPCSLLFTNHSNMYVIYPEAKTCCILCGEKEGCTVLKPSWLSNSSYTGDKVFEGKKCHGWAEPGHIFTDELYVTDENVLCQYHEKSFVGDLIHTLTFNQASYKVQQPDASIFDIPSYCKDVCPRPYPNHVTHKRSIL